MKPIIQITDLSKRYYITSQKPTSLAESLERLARNPLKFFLQKSSKNKQVFWALKDINLSIYKGDTVGIIGQNGAGKSTLLKILSGITRPTSGNIMIQGEVGTLLEAGVGFHPDLTGRDNIFLYAAMLGIKKSRIVQKFNQIVSFSGVERFLDTPVKHYSSGMYIRLAFSVAIQLEPDILFIDEVLSVGDAQFQTKSFNKIRELTNSQGITVIFVSHNIQALRGLCKKGLYLENGKMKFFGSFEECQDIYLKNKMPHHHNIITKTKNIFTITESYLHSSILYRQQPIKLTLKFIVKEEIQNALFAVVINTLDGIRIVESRSIDSIHPFSLLKPGTYELTCIITDHNLIPGQYTIGIGAGTETEQSLDYVPNACIVTIRPKKKKVFSKKWTKELSGFIDAPSIWTKPKRI